MEPAKLVTNSKESLLQRVPPVALNNHRINLLKNNLSYRSSLLAVTQPDRHRSQLLELD